MIASLKAGAEASLKAGSYVVVAVSATTVNVIAADKSFKTVNGVLNAAPLTITTAGVVEVLDQDGNTTGIELTGGSGTIALVAGNFAKIDISKGKIAIDYSIISQGGFCPRIFDIIIQSSNYSNSGGCKFAQIYIPNVSALISPFGVFTRNEFSPLELTMTKLAGTDKINIKQIEK